MSELSSNFSRDDIETLIEAMGGWEAMGNQEFHVLQWVRNLPNLPEDHEGHEVISQMKEHYNRREKEIRSHRALTQEKATFLRAKLMLVRKDLGINQLFEMAAEETPAPQEPVSKVEPVGGLQLAEFFIKDLGVWDHYQKFLVERGGKTTKNQGD